MKLIYQGAEAVVLERDGVIIKERIPKRYRLTVLDQQLRKQRTQAESSLLTKAKRAGLRVPRVLDVQGTTLELELIAGTRVRELLDVMREGDLESVLDQIGTIVAELHEAGIAHGDLTTSNMLLANGKVYLIDFGLARTSIKVEDQANDLYLLKESLEAGHAPIAGKAWEQVLKAYKRKYPKASMVMKRLVEVNKRRRYRSE